MSNGLDMMKNARGKKRTAPAMPPPRNKARTEPVNIETVASVTAEPAPPQPPTATAEPKPTQVDASPVVQPEAKPAAVSGEPAGERARPQAEPRTSAPTRAKAATPPRQLAQDSDKALLRNTVYLTDAEDDFLQSVTAVGRRGTPKVTSAAAVIRFAVRHLESAMTPQEIVDAIRAAAPTDVKQGRHVL